MLKEKMEADQVAPSKDICKFRIAITNKNKSKINPTEFQRKADCATTNSFENPFRNKSNLQVWE